MGSTTSMEPEAESINVEPAKAPGAVACVICGESRPLVNQPACTHLPDHCVDCLREHVSVQLRSHLNVVRCPSYRCEVLLETETAVRAYATKPDFEELSERLTKLAITSSPRFVHCSNPACNSGFEMDDSDIGLILSCPSCRRKTCGICRVEWHDGITCEEFQAIAELENQKFTEEERLSAEYIKANTRNCPRCHTGPYEKISLDMCDIATCSRCVPQFRFCWQCGVDYDFVIATDCSNHLPSCKYFFPHP